jgi:pimeloyl-ACP methyl ester carboxylesterase
MRAMREKTIELAETQGMAAVADYVITANPNLRIQAEASPAARQRLRQMFLDLNPTGYAHTIRAMLAETFPTAQLATLTMPTLVLVGDADPALDAAKWTHQQMPGSQLVSCHRPDICRIWTCRRCLTRAFSHFCARSRDRFPGRGNEPHALSIGIHERSTGGR